MVFISILTPIVQNIRAGNSIMAKLISLLLKVAISVLAIGLWVATLIDQLPCFLGVPYCD
jgi:uncharacterized membrane protein YiaA